MDREMTDASPFTVGYDSANDECKDTDNAGSHKRSVQLRVIHMPFDDGNQLIALVAKGTAARTSTTDKP